MSSVGVVDGAAVEMVVDPDDEVVDGTDIDVLSGTLMEETSGTSIEVDSGTPMEVLGDSGKVLGDISDEETAEEVGKSGVVGGVVV